MDDPVSEADSEHLSDASEETIATNMDDPISERDSEYLSDASEETIAANMDVPIRKIDVEYLIDAADKSQETFFEDETEYIPYILLKEAEKTLKKQGHTEYTKELEDRIRDDLSVITHKGIPKRPKEYRRNESIIKVLVQHYYNYNVLYPIRREEDEKHKKWGSLSENFQELEGESAMRERFFRTCKALRTALKMLCRVERGDTPEEVFIQENGIPEEYLQDTEYDEEGSNETYNIIPFDGHPDLLPEYLQDTRYDEEGSNETYNIIPFDGRPDLLPEVKEAIEEMKWGIEATPSPTRGRDVLDCLQKFFGFQESSVSNQRENIVNLLSNELMRPFTPGEHGTASEQALEKVFLKSLDNYIKWCSYLSIKPIWKNTDVHLISKEKKILYISLYYLIWGEAANVRFLPECLCYIFHRMSGELDDKCFNSKSNQQMSEQLDVQHVSSGSFIERVIQPLYDVIAAEAKINSKRDAPHSTWRNYDDFNEYFWSPDCFQLGWPFNKESHFFDKPSEGSTTVYGKTSFVEHRTFFHLYHSFHRMWIFHVMMFQALVIFAFNDEKLNSITLREILSVGPTYFFMKLFQSMLDIVLKDGAYSNTSRADVLRIRFHIICFRAFCFMSTLIIFFLGIFRKSLQEKTSSVEESIAFYACIVVLVIYACIIKWINELEEHIVRCMDEELLDSYLKEEYVGRGMDEKPTDYIKYMIFWIVTLTINFAFTYYGLIRPLVRPTRDITDVSKNIHNMLAIGSLWAGVICAYIVGSHVSYNVTSSVVGYIVGHMDCLGKIKFLGDVHKCFDKIPTAFMDHLNVRESRPENNQKDVKKNRKLDATEFSSIWNDIVKNLREEDYISDLEQQALRMPEKEKSGCIDVIEWPLFLLVGKVFLAIKIAAKSDSQKEMWDEISRDVNMKYAVEECFHSVKFILRSVLDYEGQEWVEGTCNDIESSIRDGNLCSKFQFNELDSFVKTISRLTEILNKNSRNILPINEDKEILKKVIRHQFLGGKNGRRRFSVFTWPTDPELRSQIERLHLLLTMDKSAAHVPRNREARRRLEFFTNSLFMSMPTTKPVREMLSFSVLTPFYEEKVIYSLEELQSSNDDGVTLIDYLKNLYPDEWNNYRERIGNRCTHHFRERDECRLGASYRGQSLARTDDRNNYCERLDKRYIDNAKDSGGCKIMHQEEDLELRLWASYRGQTLARTVRGTMYYQKALLLQAYREGSGVDGQSSTSPVLDVSMDDVSMDEDTRATLNSLEERSSHGELLVQTSGIMLRDKENYHPWRDQMMEMLESENVIGFVDGSLRDPDPIGESQEEHVCNYSQNWKRLDKKVKDWIMVSLNDTLKNMVKEMRTAKGLWEMLEMYFSTGSQGLNECLDKAKAHVDLKFTYVISCQIYGKQKREGKDVAADIAFLLKRNEGLRVAFIDEINNKFYSKLVKADKNGKHKEVYSIKLPGNPIIGEGKPENQNHAIVFTRGNAIQTIDMNQDNYFEETLKMRNLLEEFHRKDVIHPPTILGIREHIFTGSASSLASFMSNQETGFVTLGQRVIANPLKVRMHYGHPDVFDRVFHITRGGISKASRGINISEDIYAGFNSTLRQGSVTHHEYIQVGKGRDVGFNQIAIFEGKVAGGNGEQVLSRDIYRLGQRFDFFRMLSFYYTTVGYYFSSLLMVITLYILLYGNLIMALSGTKVPDVLNDIDLTPELLLITIVLLPAICMLLVPLLEQGLEKAVESFLAMFFSLCSIFFAFSLGTRIHWFGRTIIHGGASYQATGRGFVLHHIKFSENYRLYSRSHFVKGMEVLFLIVVYVIYGFHSVRAFYNNLLLFGGLILSISWIIAPFLFDSSPFDLNKNSEDWEDWNNWRNFKSVPVEEGILVKESVAVEETVSVEKCVPAKKSVPVEKSWEAWWNKELDHIRTPAGRVIETILSLRFFIFPLVVGYKLDVQELTNSLSNCVIPWICLMGFLFAYEFISLFLKKKPVIQFFSNNRVATIGALAFAIAYYYAFGYMLAFTIAIITIVWGFISFLSNFGVGTIGPLVIVRYYFAFGHTLAFIIAIITTVWGFLSFFFNNRLATIGALAIAYYCSALADTLAFSIAVITTVWGFVSICVAWKPALERYRLWTPVTYLAWICDTGMGALLFKIAKMFSQRSIKQYLLRNLFVHNVSEYLQKSPQETATVYGRTF